MERNKIIELARQVDLEDADFPFDEWEPVELIAFAKLVASTAIAKEREACAKLADDADKYNRHISREIALAIRARSGATSRGEA